MAKDSFTMGAEEARRVVKALQGHEREQLRQAGRRKLDELRALKAAAMQLVQAHSDAKLLQQQQQKQQQLLVTTQAPAAASSCLQGPEDTQLPLNAQEARAHDHTSSASSADSLPVQIPPADDVTQQHDACRPAASAVAVAAGGVAAGAAAVAANAGSRAAAPSGPIVVDPAAAAVADVSTEPLAAAADGSSAAVSTQWQEQLEQPREQPQEQQQQLEDPVDVAVVQDPMVDMLLQQVEALMSEKQQLAAKCCGLERENEQLAELVGHLHVTLEEHQELQEQQEQQQSLDFMQEPISEGDEGDEELAMAESGEAEAAADTAEPMLSQSPTSSTDEVMMPASPSKLELSAAEDPAIPVLSGGPVQAVVMPIAAAGVEGQEQLFLAKQKHMRVAEWLDHRPGAGSSSNQSWQQWQEQLPLEPMSSGSSSTLTITLADP